MLANLAALITLPLVAGADGRNHDLLREAHGRPTVLIFITHDCPICNTYVPELNRIASAYKPQIKFDLVYAELNIQEKTVQEHAKTYSLKNAELLLDPKGRLTQSVGANISPEAVVLDHQGQIAYRGRIDDLFYDYGKQRPSATTHDLRRAIDAILNHKPATPASGPPFGCVIEVASKP